MASYYEAHALAGSSGAVGESAGHALKLVPAGSLIETEWQSPPAKQKPDEVTGQVG